MKIVVRGTRNGVVVVKVVSNLLITEEVRMEELLIMKRIEHDPPQAFQYPTSIYVQFVLHTTYEEYLCEEDRLQQSS